MNITTAYLNVNYSPLENFELLVHQSAIETKDCEYIYTAKEIHHYVQELIFGASYWSWVPAAKFFLNQENEDISSQIVKFELANYGVVVLATGISIVLQKGFKHVLNQRVEAKINTINLIVSNIFQYVSNQQEFETRLYAAAFRFKDKPRPNHINAQLWDQLLNACNEYVQKTESDAMSKKKELSQLVITQDQLLAESSNLSIAHSPLRNACILANHRGETIELRRANLQSVIEIQSKTDVIALGALSGLTFAQALHSSKLFNDDNKQNLTALECVKGVIIFGLNCSLVTDNSNEIVSQEKKNQAKLINVIFNRIKIYFLDVKENKQDKTEEYEICKTLVEKINLLKLPPKLQSPEWINLKEVSTNFDT